MDIDKLEGRELDRAVAEARGRPFRIPTHGSCCTCQTCGHYYDECQCGIGDDIAAAWPLLLEMMAGSGGLVRFCNGDGDSYDIDAMRGHVHMSVDTEEEIPTMIARAWLKWRAASD